MPDTQTVTETQLREIEARPSVQAAWSQRIELRVEERDALCRSLRAAWANELRLAQEVVTLRAQNQENEESLKAQLAQSVTLTKREARILTDYHYYEAEKAITRLGCKPAQRAAPTCGFCRKSNTEVKALIKAPVGYICEECVAICASIIQRNVSATAPSQPARDAQITTDLGDLPLSLIDEIKERRRTLYKGFDYAANAAQMKTDLDYALAFLDALPAAAETVGPAWQSVCVNADNPRQVGIIFDSPEAADLYVRNLAASSPPVPARPTQNEQPLHRRDCGMPNCFICYG